MPLKPCQRSLRNAIVPRGTTFTIRVWSLRTVIQSERAPVSVTTAVICFLSCRGWPSSLVMQDQMDVCPLARGALLRVGSTPLHPMTEWPLLLPSSSSRTPIGLPYGSLSLTGDVRGCHVPSQSQRMGEARSLHRERGMPMTRKGGILGPALVPFWLKPARTFGLLSLTMF